MDMEQNRNDPNQNKKPEGDKPKSQMWTALIITLALVLIFSWVYNTVKNSQYTQTSYTEFRTAMEWGIMHPHYAITNARTHSLCPAT